MPRCFVALLLDDSVRRLVAEEIERLRPLSRAVAWVPAPNLHLTLKFLGDQGEARLDQVVQALEEAAAVTAPFSVSLHGLGAFPGLERPRVLWVGLGDGALRVRELQGSVEQALTRRGFPQEPRPWHPHLTIGRVFDDRRWRRERTAALDAAVARAGRADYGVLPVTAVALMRSALSPSGARYHEIASVMLAGRSRNDAGGAAAEASHRI